MTTAKRLHNEDEDLEEDKMCGVEKDVNFSDRSSDEVYPRGSDTSETNSVETGNFNFPVSCNSYF